MQLPVMPPVAPMLAKAVRALPRGAGLVYEPKWDGFRALVFRDGDEIEITSRNEQSLTRYFPELAAPLSEALPARCVLDGEIVIVGENGLDFESLLQRIHPAATRVARLAAETPAAFVAFDLLAVDDEDLRAAPFGRRRARLEDLLGARRGVISCTPATTDPERAEEWFHRFEGGGLDGVVIKRADLAYRPGERAMEKWKHQRSADCVIAGLRRQKDGAVASLLLGLYDAHGTLHHVGVAASFTAQRRRELAELLAPLELAAGEPHPWTGAAETSNQRRPGAESRWSQKRDLSFVALRPEVVCEVAYDHLQGDRFRHATTFVRFRPERVPASCTYDQLESVPPAELAELVGRPVH